MKYRKKPVEVEAWQWNGQPFEEWPLWLQASDSGIGALPSVMCIKTLEGTMRAHPGEWIIKGVQGELYPCKPDIFEATYEAVK